MKLKIKSHYVYLAAIVIVGAIGINLYNHDENLNQFSDIALANIDALMQSENDSEKGNSGSSIPCYSSASRDYNKAYVDCSSCSRIEGWKGTGTQASCTTN